MDGYNQQRLLSKTDTALLKERLRAHWHATGKFQAEIAVETGMTVVQVSRALAPNGMYAGHALTLAKHWGIPVPGR